MVLQALQLSQPSRGAYVVECSSAANSWGVSHASRADQLLTNVSLTLLPLLLLPWRLSLLPFLLLLLPRLLKRGVGRGSGVEASRPPCRGAAVTRSSHW